MVGAMARFVPPSELLFVLFGGGLAFLGATILWLGAKAWRRRRPIVVPARWVMPVIGLFALAELARFGRRSTSGAREWGSVLDWVLLGGMVAVVAIVVVIRMRVAGRCLYVGGLASARGLDLARAALDAVAPDRKAIVDEDDSSIVRIAKEGPGLQVKARRLLGVVVFSPEGDIPDGTRDELFSGIARCLDVEELSLRPALAVRVFACGVLMIGLGAALAALPVLVPE